MSSPDDIAASLHRIYTIFQAIGYISPEDIVLPPHDETAIDFELCRSVGMSDATVEFLSMIPWAIAGSGDLIKDSEIIDFSNEYCVRHSRHFCDASKSGSAVGAPREVDGSLVSLTMRGQHGRSLVVDTSRGTIRIWDGKGDVLAIEEQNACAVLNAMYNRYYDLEEIPFELCILAPIPDASHDVAEPRVCVFCGDELSPRPQNVAERRVCALCGRDLPGSKVVENNHRYETIKALAQRCGWPDDFDVEAFKAGASELPSPSKTGSGSSSDSSDGNGENGTVVHEQVPDQSEGRGNSGDLRDGTFVAGTIIREWVHDQTQRAENDRSSQESSE
ncbi:hypothetical protein LTR10_017961 [Elasticomyces elasticus]|uniref:Uncharacterized protein n=1 Tax=Exophiala sideris TaxID=1016849 RepID=A0ABR0J9P8_9EURO|nr:hypothetical protein LTR10_017961 [Elasticomyces elasticus]KAK5026056.1 hypothetical protein LTS07_007581 [Exophiala sideris]KAK5032311.1 hypothetical protein LTR13_007134 [Exophiala sideris]KAK5059466.1 hypothetical protein LTR69_006055 [Exophiala sideris]KAK5186629.1 hypothetical protein LTR44_000635 [Eurotiomycetes sp. CCFEE 6388]